MKSARRRSWRVWDWCFGGKPCRKLRPRTRPAVSDGAAANAATNQVTEVLSNIDAPVPRLAYLGHGHVWRSRPGRGPAELARLPGCAGPPRGSAGASAAPIRQTRSRRGASAAAGGASLPGQGHRPAHALRRARTAVDRPTDGHCAAASGTGIATDRGPLDGAAAAPSRCDHRLRSGGLLGQRWPAAEQRRAGAARPARGLCGTGGPGVLPLTCVHGRFTVPV
jgi:hypothetical protein